MLELTKTKTGSFTAGDSMIAVDPTERDGGVIFASKPGLWNVYRLADDEHTHEVLAVHESIKTFTEEKANWCAEDMEVTVGDYCGFFDLNQFQAKENESCSDMTANAEMVGYSINEEGCLTMAGHGAGSYLVLLCRNKDGEAVASKIVFIDETVESDFESYEEDDNFDEFGLDNYSDFGDEDDEEDEDY
jgi:hypothetical protein